MESKDLVSIKIPLTFDNLSGLAVIGKGRLSMLLAMLVTPPHSDVQELILRVYPANAAFFKLLAKSHKITYEEE